MSKGIEVTLVLESGETEKFVKDLRDNNWSYLALSAFFQIQRQCKCVDCNCEVSKIEIEG